MTSRRQSPAPTNRPTRSISRLPDDRFMATRLDLRSAHFLVERGIARVREMNARDVCFSLCDAQGFLISFARMDRAPIRSIAIAQRKAYTSVRVEMGTQAFRDRLAREDLSLSDFCDPELTALPGGAVIRNAQGAPIGGIGVSGLAPAEDQQLADGIAAMELPKTHSPS